VCNYGLFGEVNYGRELKHLEASGLSGDDLLGVILLEGTMYSVVQF
jgi:hypothetical protein